MNLNFFKDKYANRYFLIAKEMGILNFNKINLEKDNLSLFRFNFKIKNPYFKYLDNIISRVIEKIQWRKKQITVILKDKKYRQYVYSKIKDIFKNFV